VYGLFVLSFVCRNPTRKESSISPNFNPPSEYHQNGQYSSNGPQNRAVSCAFNEPPKVHNDYLHAVNPVHRSQSLSATEFLRRHGSGNNRTNSDVLVGGGSLRKFSSQLRTHKLSTVGLKNHPSLSTLYTPPPILSPLRSGSGLYRSISRQGWCAFLFNKMYILKHSKKHVLILNLDFIFFSGYIDLYL
jgi:hypothetical protein